MLVLFKRDKKLGERNYVERYSPLRKYFDKYYSLIKDNWAQWMTNRAARMSYKHNLIIWIVFFVFSSSYSIFLIVTNVLERTLNDQTIIPIVDPIRNLKMGDANISIERKKNIISEDEYQRILKFRDYIDRLSRIPTAKTTYDSILVKHPGLLDSLKFIEKYYQSNLKNQ